MQWRKHYPGASEQFLGGIGRFLTVSLRKRAEGVGGGARNGCYGK